jgi:mannan endo-1,4-beta-mannosidase
VVTEATQALLTDLHSRVNRGDDRVAIGQQLLTYQYGNKYDPNAWYGDWLKLEQWGFPLPKVMGGELSDLMSYPGFWPNQDATNELIRHGQAGHIVTLVWHPSNPTWGDFSTPISTADLWAMTDDATEIGQRWQTQLDRAAAVLQQFEDAGVPVLFRPMHEQNGTFFWWGHNGATGAALRERQAAWVAVWRNLVVEMRYYKELQNLLFVFGTNHVNYNGVAAPMTYYPGGFWADVVSIDVYDEELDLAGSEPGVQHYAALIGTGKPFGLAEFGQSFGDGGTDFDGWNWDARTLANRIHASYPRTVFATAWYSSWEWGNPYIFGLPDVAYSWYLLNDPLFDKQ